MPIPTNLTNGFKEDTSESSKQLHERGRTREKKDEKNKNAEFLNHMAVTMQNLQRDLDRITGRVRSLEGQALHVLAPQSVCSFYLFYFLLL